VFSNPEAKEALRALSLIQNLPDSHHWKRYLWEVAEDDKSRYYDILSKAVAFCFDHQSQESTDIRWLKVMFMILAGRLFLPASTDDRNIVEELRLYPEYGDQRKVRPFIRATESTFRGIAKASDGGGEVPPKLAGLVSAPWGSAFWKEMLESTHCIFVQPNKTEVKNEQQCLDETLDVYYAVSRHFYETLSSTSVDARHDASFCIVLYACSLVIGLARGNVHRRAEGRIILRTVVELFITLHFLVLKDDQTIWTQFRNYGSGQTKLAFLKNIQAESVPDFVNVDELHRYANEDFWQEYVEINLKAWSDRNLRSLAIEGGVKDVYDKYYDWSSGFVHGHWGAIRDTNMTVCLNPLHRFHRVPFLPRLDMPSTLGDGCRLLNRMLDDLSSLYPTIKDRIKWKWQPDVEVGQESSEEGEA
jgi:hypothetical protein